MERQRYGDLGNTGKQESARKTFNLAVAACFQTQLYLFRLAGFNQVRMLGSKLAEPPRTSPRKPEISTIHLNMETRIALFQKKEIRKTLHDGEWWFVVEDVVFALTDSRDPKQYIQRMRQRDTELAKGWVQIVHTLLIETAGGPQKLNCANTEGIFRLIQSIPSRKAEPFKRWLARVGYERIQEIEDPEIATKRTRALYKAKGYSDAWIEKRMRSIAIRDELTGEWKKRGVKEQLEYSILTAEISKAAFGLTPTEYKELKGLQRENLRDHMSDLELIFSMLGEAATTEIARNTDAQGFPRNKKAAAEGGTVAGNARQELEQKSGRKVVSRENYLDAPESKKRLSRG